MIWYAPIWLNSLLVDILSLIIGAMFFSLFISLIFIIINLIKLLISREFRGRKLLNLIRMPSIIIFIISSIGLGLFYMPKRVIPKQCRFSGISIESGTASVIASRISIVDKEKLKELRALLSEYSCRRSLDRERIIDPDSNVTFIDMVIYSKDKSSPIHFIIGSDYGVRYTAANTDFNYLINDSDHKLAQKISDFYDKCKGSK